MRIRTRTLYKFRLVDNPGVAVASMNTSAFELSRWRGGRYRVVVLSIVGIRFGSQGGYCDPSQKADAG